MPRLCRTSVPIPAAQVLAAVTVKKILLIQEVARRMPNGAKRFWRDDERVALRAPGCVYSSYGGLVFRLMLSLFQRFCFRSFCV